MKNKISDLRDHMFAALERLGDADITEEQLKVEISKAQAISDLGKVIVDSVKSEILYAKVTHNRDFEPKKFLEINEEKKELVRPKAEYSNTNFS